MNTITAKPRPALLGLVLIAFGCGLTATASADDWAAPRPRLFTSENGRHGFKVLPKNTAGVLFSLDDDGKDQVIWNKQLVNVPHQVFVAEDGKHVVTIDTYADLGREHSLVVYDAKGKVLGDYRLEELLSEQEIRDRVIETAPNRWWASEASFKYRDRGQDTTYFEIALKWGKVITVNLDTGKLEIDRPPAKGDQGQRPVESAEAARAAFRSQIGPALEQAFSGEHRMVWLRRIGAAMGEGFSKARFEPVETYRWQLLSQMDTSDEESWDIRRLPFSEALKQVEGSLPEKGKEDDIVLGTTDDLRRDGDCWKVHYQADFRGEFTAYVDAATGKLVFIRLVLGGPVIVPRAAKRADASKKVSVTLVLSEREYDPVDPSKAVLKCVVRNDTAEAVDIPVGYDGREVQLVSDGLILRHVLPGRGAAPAKKEVQVKPVQLKPGEEQVVFELALDEILLKEEKSREEWRWDWRRRPEPPRSPVHRWRKAGFNDQAAFRAKVMIGGGVLESDTVDLKVKAIDPAK